MRDRAEDGQSVREDLGTSTIEGLPATGTRTTTTIAAGAIGNVQPIKIVSEEWFSPDLQVLVLTKHNDPRSGETVYRLLNVVRAEPDPSLFAVPADEPIGKEKPGVAPRRGISDAQAVILPNHRAGQPSKDEPRWPCSHRGEATYFERHPTPMEERSPVSLK